MVSPIVGSLAVHDGCRRCGRFSILPQYHCIASHAKQSTVSVLSISAFAHHGADPPYISYESLLLVKEQKGTDYIISEIR